MKPLKSFIYLTLSTIILFSCTPDKTIKLPLTKVEGFGHIFPSAGGLTTNTTDENDSWYKTQLKVTGAPTDWTDIQYGHIETNIYQSAYQNYHQGNITEDHFEELQAAWKWQPDSIALSKSPIKSRVAFATGLDTAGIKYMIVDTNNNLDLSDDDIFLPPIFNESDFEKFDSIAINNIIYVAYERKIKGKIESLTAPLFIGHFPKNNIYVATFPEHLETEFNGQKIEICSDACNSLSYQNPQIALIDRNNDDKKFDFFSLKSKNDFIDINDQLYKIMAVNLNKNILELERIDVEKKHMQHNDIGFQAFPFEGEEFTDSTLISLTDMKGKYVLLDFWAVWCGPCRQEIPNLRATYDKTDRSKFEIISIVGDSPVEALAQLIEKDSITWPQILSTDSNKIKETYGIKGYPTTLLVDPEGIIIAKNLRGESLDAKLEELL